MPKLTAAALARYKPGPSRREIRDTGSDGLILLIQPSGTKSWVMRFRRPSGRHAKLTLGSVDETGKEATGEPRIGGHHTLVAARRLAAEVQRSRRMGFDVVADRERTKQDKPLAFGDAAVDFVETYARKRQRRWRGTASHLGLRLEQERLIMVRGELASRWRDRPVTEISRRDIADVLAATADRAPHVANAQHATLRRMFNWLSERHLVEDNPCAKIRRPTPASVRDRVLLDDEVKRIWHAVDKLGHPWTTLIRLLFLTGQRLNEVARMEWRELSDDGAVWTLPKERTKNKRAHVVPLPSAAQDLIGDTPRIDGCRFVLSTNGQTPISGFSKMKTRLDRIIEESGGGALPHWRLHDLRRTAVTGMARVGAPLPVIERVINHVSGSFAGVVGVYQRHEFADEKRDALERWASLVTELIAANSSAEVERGQD